MRSARFYDALVFSLEFFECFDQKLLTAGRSLSSIAITAEMCIAVGKVSFEDWLILMSSFGWQSFCTGNLVCAVCNNLVCVHIGLCARTCLPNNKREMIVKCARYNLIARC